MNGSPTPSAPAGISSPPLTVEIPAGMFFDAGDYNLGNTHPAHLEATRFKVARHRSKLKASIALQLEDLARINSSLHAADRQGNAAPHWDSAVTLAAKLQKSVAHLADQLDKAERRYEESQLAPSALGAELAEAPEVQQVVPGSLRTGSTMVRPSSLAEQIRKSA